VRVLPARRLSSKETSNTLLEKNKQGGKKKKKRKKETNKTTRDTLLKSVKDKQQELFVWQRCSGTGLPLRTCQHII